MWRKRWVLATSLVVACFVVGLISVVLIERSLHRPAAQLEMAQFERTVDLSSYGTFRGTDTIPLREVSLPAALVRLQIVLPRLSNQGNYTVTVSRDREGNDTVARAQGVATGSDPRTVLTVTLDLRTARPGRYFLSTERESDGGAYYYPLEIRN